MVIKLAKKSTAEGSDLIHSIYECILGSKEPVRFYFIDDKYYFQFSYSIVSSPRVKRLSKKFYYHICLCDRHPYVSPGKVNRNEPKLKNNI